MNSFDKVYKIVSLIPKGKVVTYKQISELSGLNPRIVGFALHANRNTRDVPCHRVVNIVGNVAKGYAFGGREEQKRKLKNEKVTFLDEVAVDLSKHQHFFAN